MNVAIQAFSANGKQMSTAIESLELEAQSIRKLLDQAVTLRNPLIFFHGLTRARF
jgi:hypothetical protein